MSLDGSAAEMTVVRMNWNTTSAANYDNYDKEPLQRSKDAFTHRPKRDSSLRPVVRSVVTGSRAGHIADQKYSIRFDSLTHIPTGITRSLSNCTTVLLARKEHHPLEIWTCDCKVNNNLRYKGQYKYTIQLMC